MGRFVRVVPGVFLTVAALAMPSAKAAESEVRASYKVVFLGLEIAKANLAVKVKDDLYTLRLGYRTAGVAAIGSAAKGEVQASGQIKGAKVLTGSYKLSSEEGEDSKDVAIDLDSGKVRSVNATPPLKEAADRVAVTPAKLAGVVDPLSALVVPLDKPDAPLTSAVCDRAVPIFDGWTRYDLQLSPKSEAPVKIKGYSGPTVTCAVRWIPVAGHRPNATGTKFMAENKDIEVTLAPTRTGLLLPVRISLKTRSGTAIITADKLDLDGDAKGN